VTNIYVEVERLNGEIIACRKCPRLVEWREQVANEKRKAYQDWEYWGKPVPGFGDPNAEILVVGLAPGAHGSNRTGRMFTGDASGDFLYPALHRAGFSNLSKAANRNDGLILDNLYITAAARCAPPGNKPDASELENCRSYLEQEIRLIKPRVIVCLGRVAFERVLRIFSLQPAEYEFGHAAVYRIGSDNVNDLLPTSDTWLLCSYHPSQQNTATGKLTVIMFDEIWKKAKSLLAQIEPKAGQNPS
jgi:uracil-DNA glycosylase family 4